MAYSTTNLYPEDLNGTNPANLITNEPQTLQVPGPEDYYFIIPKAAPFFVDSVKVLNAATMQPYVEGDDYQLGHQFIEAMDSTGRPIAGSIRFMRPTITGQVLITYRTLGGPWGFSDQAIMRELSNKLVNPLIRSWGDIDPLPYSFPPLPHDQRIDTLIGSKQINDTLIHIAEIMEATAEGTTQSHLNDFNNPHRVNKTQVGLGNVPNFAMATDQEHQDGTRNDLFTNPRGVLLMIQKFALVPLDAHIADYGNPHRVNKSQVGLGNVPNFAKATAAQAIDPTNDSTFMTPYTAALLVQSMSNDPRLDQLILDFNEHITANNPHNITPALIGTYTSEQIDDMIDAVSRGGDAATFDGQDAAQWEAKFPSNADMNAILDELFQTFVDASTAWAQLDVSDPLTPAEKDTIAARRLSWTFGDYNAYALYNSLGDGVIQASSEVGNGFPTGAVANMVGRWGTTSNGAYYVNDNGTVKVWGSGPVTLPTKYTNASDAAFDPIAAVYPSLDWVILHSRAGEILRVSRGTAANGTGVVLKNGDNIVWSMYLNNGMADNRVCAIYEDSESNWFALGDTSWVAACNALLSAATAADATVLDVRIGTNTLVIITETGPDTAKVQKVYVYAINWGGTITLTDVSGTTAVRNHTTGEVLMADQLTGVTQVAGSFNHTVLTRPIAPDQELCDLLSFGDDSNGQLEIPATSAPFLAIGAGYGFTVTINQFRYAEFWGDSPDNSLLYRGSASIAP
ncbi:tail protein [Pseudomonas phage 201phi2-1]|uniref:Virion structural protein n=1 Tax=Pseudomonas phage 201phi2-1 TaxID=198110 RepID=B3FJ78_BP201|nr:tail protein [Pseudomonas phage 201phi2-1]ABY63045.1 virion structural protein [Pseudomonas phage 201phi2-1]